MVKIVVKEKGENKKIEMLHNNMRICIYRHVYNELTPTYSYPESHETPKKYL